MRIACPTCAAAYEVPDRLLAGPARTLRCSRCGTDFTLAPAAPPEPLAEAPHGEPPSDAPPAAEPPAAEAPAPEPAPAEPPPPAPPTVAEREPPRRAAPLTAPRPPPPQVEAVEAPGRGMVGAWLASVAAVLAAVFALLVFRAKVMEFWPASERLFLALGLT